MRFELPGNKDGKGLLLRMKGILQYSTVKKMTKQGLIRLFSLGLMMFVLLPIVWLLLSSVKQDVELLSKPPTFLPKQLTLENYVNLFLNEKVVHTLKNSLIVSLFTTLISLVIGIFGAYAFARFRFRGRNALYLSILGTQMLPAMAILIPLFVLLRVTGLLYTFQGLITSYVAFSLPYVIWMYHAFLQSLPHEIEEAARIDGCSRLQIIYKIVIPLSASGLSATGIFVFIGAWNEFLLALALTQSGTRTLPVQIAEFIVQDRVQYEILFPTSIISCLPVLLVVLFFQKYIVKGLTEGAVK
jgi:multiple sugar transport system permease protein